MLAKRTVVLLKRCAEHSGFRIGAQVAYAHRWQGERRRAESCWAKRRLRPRLPTQLGGRRVGGFPVRCLTWLILAGNNDMKNQARRNKPYKCGQAALGGGLCLRLSLGYTVQLPNHRYRSKPWRHAPPPQSSIRATRCWCVSLWNSSMVCCTSCTRFSNCVSSVAYIAAG